MNLRHTAEVAALASAYSAHVIESPRRMPDGPLHAFWQHAKRQMHGWLRELTDYEAQVRSAGCSGREERWRRIEPVLEELFVSEILNRVWSAVLVAADARQQTCRSGPIAHNVMLGQLKARQHAEKLLVDVPHELQSSAARLDRLRRRTERWTDVLLGHLVVQYPVNAIAFVEERSREFGERQLAGGLTASQSNTWNFTLAGLRLAFPATRHTIAQADSDAQRVVQAVLQAFPADAFHADGPLKTVLHARIFRSGLHPEGPVALPMRATSPTPPSVDRPAPKGGAPRVSVAKLRRRFREGR